MSEKTKSKKTEKRSVGRQWFDGKDEKAVVAKLEQVFAIDGTVEEACSYAEISRDSYYRYIKENEELRDRFEHLRQRPILKARQTINKNLDNPQYALEYLKRKRKQEFSERTENTGADGQPIQFSWSEQSTSHTLPEGSSKTYMRTLPDGK